MKARLDQLEKRASPAPKFLAIFHTIVEVDGTVAEPDRFETPDGKFSWSRMPGEDLADFENRVADDAARITSNVAVALIPFDVRGQ